MSRDVQDGRAGRDLLAIDHSTPRPGSGIVAVTMDREAGGPGRGRAGQGKGHQAPPPLLDSTRPSLGPTRRGKHLYLQATATLPHLFSLRPHDTANAWLASTQRLRYLETEVSSKVQILEREACEHISI